MKTKQTNNNKYIYIYIYIYIYNIAFRRLNHEVKLVA